MSGKLSSLRKRLEVVEKLAAEKAEREKPVCTCKVGQGAITWIYRWKPELLEAEMNQTCPIHGFRDLGRLVMWEIDFGIEDDRSEEHNSRINELVAGYEARKSQNSEAKIEHDSTKA